MIFTATEKHAEARREVAMRKAVYAKRVLAGTMTEAERERGVALMEAIAADYRGWAEKEKLEDEAKIGQGNLI